MTGNCQKLRGSGACDSLLKDVDLGALFGQPLEVRSAFCISIDAINRTKQAKAANVE